MSEVAINYSVAQNTQTSGSLFTFSTTSVSDAQENLSEVETCGIHPGRWYKSWITIRIEISIF